MPTSQWRNASHSSHFHRRALTPYGPLLPDLRKILEICSPKLGTPNRCWLAPPASALSARDRQAISTTTRPCIAERQLWCIPSVYLLTKERSGLFAPLVARNPIA